MAHGQLTPHRFYLNSPSQSQVECYRISLGTLWLFSLVLYLSFFRAPFFGKEGGILPYLPSILFLITEHSKDGTILLILAFPLYFRLKMAFILRLLVLCQVSIY